MTGLGFFAILYFYGGNILSHMSNGIDLNYLLGTIVHIQVSLTCSQFGYEIQLSRRYPISSMSWDIQDSSVFVHVRVTSPHMEDCIVQFTRNYLESYHG